MRLGPSHCAAGLRSVARRPIEADHPDPLPERGGAAPDHPGGAAPLRAGFDEVEWLVIDDGSTDDTVRWPGRSGSSSREADEQQGPGLRLRGGTRCRPSSSAPTSIVNTDADNQYDADDIPALVAPILAGVADMVVGDRGVADIEHFSPRRSGSRSSAARWCGERRAPRCPTPRRGSVPTTARRRLGLTVVSRFTYTLESLIQAGKGLVAVSHVPVGTNEKLRESRLFGSMSAYVRRNVVALFRIYTAYEPLRVFTALAVVSGSRRPGVEPVPVGLDRERRPRRPPPVRDPRRCAAHGRACSASPSACSPTSSPRTGR